MRLDLPTFDLPRKAISGTLSRGQSASLRALLRKSALVIFIQNERLPFSLVIVPLHLRLGSGGNSRGSTRLLLTHRRKLLETFFHAGHARFNVWHALDNSFQTLQEIRIVEHCAEVGEDWLKLHVNDQVLAIGLIEQLF